MISEPGPGDIARAARRLAGNIVRTPLLEWPEIGARTGGRVLVKPEMPQRTGAFKIRGAWNAVASLGEAARRAGVVAYSSGNHGQAVAAAASAHGVPATIVMPADAPAVKTAATRAWGARIVAYDRATEARESLAAGVAEETGAHMIPPFDDPRIIAGQGTVGLEIAQDLDRRGIVPDAVLVPVGGGGLIAGTAIAMKDAFPAAEMIAVEPAGFDDTARSLLSGSRERAAPDAETFCDALRAPRPGVLTFAINRGLLARGIAVSDREAARAMTAIFSGLKLVAEPGGAVATAALLSGGFDARGRTVVVVCSGGNVDPAVFRRVLRTQGARSGGVGVAAR